MIKLTILLPTYNRSILLESCLDALFAKGYLSNSEIEVIVGDNCSTDNTQEVLIHKEIRSIRNNRNLGYARNILNLIEKVSGEYIWIIGDDDRVLLEAEKLLSLLSSEGGIFVFNEEWTLGPDDKLNLPRTSIAIPLGFISNVIMKNHPDFKSYIESNLGLGTHDSPHFFARWALIIRNKMKVQHLGFDIVSSVPVLSSRFKSYIYVVLLGSYDRSTNWYYAYKECSLNQKDLWKVLTKSAFTTCFVNNLRLHRDNSGTKFYIYWFFRLWHALILKPDYAMFMIGYITAMERGLNVERNR